MQIDSSTSGSLPQHGSATAKVNRSATEMLLATTRFTAKTVPLLRGGVVVATHDAAGELDGLSWQQLELLIENSCTLTTRDDRCLTVGSRATRGVSGATSSPQTSRPALAWDNTPLPGTD